MKQAQEVLPDGCGFGVVIGVVAALDKEIAEKLRRKGKRLSHVLAKEDKDAAVENFLRKPDEPSFRARKAWGAFRVLFEKGQVEPLAKLPAFGIERVFQFAVTESLSPNENEQKTLAAGRKQRFPMKHLWKRIRSNRASSVWASSPDPWKRSRGWMVKRNDC